MDVQQAVTRLRAATKRSQNEFADPIGLTGGRISQVENGRGGLHNKHVLRMLEHYAAEVAALGLSLRDFVTPAPPRDDSRPTA